jgi:hypothetical protein
MNNPIRRGLLALFVALGAAALTPRAAAAQFAPADSLHACYVPTSGTVYRIRATGTPSSCTKTSHVPFAWLRNNGLRRTRIVPSPLVTGTTASQSANCRADEIVTGGGYELADLVAPRDNGFIAHVNAPHFAGSGALPGWRVVFSANQSVAIRVFAICAPA